MSLSHGQRSLYSLLHPPPGRFTSILANVGSIENSLQLLSYRLNIALQIADGLRYLHNVGIVYANLTSRKIHIDNMGKVHMYDFGTNEFASRSGPTPRKYYDLRWTAPELVIQDRIVSNKASDIYSFGIILWEILTDECPWIAYVQNASDNVVTQTPTYIKIRDVFSPMPCDIATVLSKCLRVTPEDRPEVQEIFDVLQTAVLQAKVQEGSIDERCPRSFICPLSIAVMKHPVICADGYSYERSAILSYMRRCRNSPVTGQELANHTLTNNAWLSRAITIYEGRTMHPVR